MKKDNDQLRNKISESDYLILENTQLRKLIDEQVETSSNLVSSRVMLDKQSPYLNSFIIKSGANHKIKNGMAVLDGKNFIGRIVDVNFFSSRVLLISDLNSKIPVVIEPSGNHAILSGHGERELTLEYLPENHTVKDGDKIYTSGKGAIFSAVIPVGISIVKDGDIVFTSGKEGVFFPGTPIGKVKLEKEEINVSLFSNLSQITFVNISLGESDKRK